MDTNTKKVFSIWYQKPGSHSIFGSKKGTAEVANGALVIKDRAGNTVYNYKLYPDIQLRYYGMGGSLSIRYMNGQSIRIFDRKYAVYLVNVKLLSFVSIVLFLLTLIFLGSQFLFLGLILMFLPLSTGTKKAKDFIKAVLVEAHAPESSVNQQVNSPNILLHQPAATANAVSAPPDPLLELNPFLASASGFFAKGMFAGRLGLKGVWIGNLYTLLFFFSLVVLGTLVQSLTNIQLADGSPLTSVIAVLFIILWFPSQFSMFIRRVHDLNKPPWFWLLLIAPIASLIPFFYIYFMPGVREANSYGMPDHGPYSPRRILFSNLGIKKN